MKSKNPIANKNIAEEVAKILLKINAVTLNPKKPFRYTSGILSPVYTDCRILISCPREREIIRDLYIKSIKSLGVEFNVIAGTATAGIPHAAWVAEKLKLPMVYVRGKAKDHGKGNQIEGSIRKGQKVAVIEDLISTGDSSIGTVKALREAGAKTSYIFAITTYKMKRSEDNFKENKIKLISLTDFDTTVKVAEKEGYVKKEDQNLIMEWVNNPTEWAKKVGLE